MECTVVWHHSLLLMNSFYKNRGCCFLVQVMLPEGFPFHQFNTHTMSICIVQVSVRLLGDRQHLAMQRDLVRRRVFHLGGRVYGSSGGGLWRALCSRGHPSTLQWWANGAHIWMVLLLYSCFWYVIHLWLSSSCNFWVPFLVGRFSKHLNVYTFFLHW